MIRQYANVVGINGGEIGSNSHTIFAYHQVIATIVTVLSILCWLKCVFFSRLQLMIIFIWLCLYACVQVHVQEEVRRVDGQEFRKLQSGYKGSECQLTQVRSASIHECLNLFCFLCLYPLFSPSSCCFSTGGAVWFQPISLSYYTFYSLCKSTEFAWILVQCVSKFPRLPSWFLAPSPPWDWPLYVFPPKSGSQVSWGTQFFFLNHCGLKMTVFPSHQHV